MQKLCNSIQSDPDFLFNRPVLVNEVNGKLNVYAGNQRIRAAFKLGWKQIPCIVEHDLSDEVVKKRVVLDNRTMGEWDYDLLANEHDIDMLVECGFNEKDFDIDIDDIESEDKPEKKKKKLKTCPNCNHEF